MISPNRAEPPFGRKQPLHWIHAAQNPVPNPFGEAWTPSESRIRVPRCDAATARQPPTPGRLELLGVVESPRDRGVAPSQGDRVVRTATAEIESALRLSNEPFSTIPMPWAPCQQRRRSGAWSGRDCDRYVARSE